MTAEAASLVSAPVNCYECLVTREFIAADELEPLLVDGELPCPCGGIQTFVGRAGLAEAVSR